MPNQEAAPGLTQELQLVLQHSDISSDAAAVCSLLCAGKSVQQAVMGALIGRVSVKPVGDAARSNKTSFVRKFGVLLKDVELNLAIPRTTEHEELALAFQFAGLQPLGLHIQSFKSRTASAQFMYMLQSFRNTLTSLDLSWNDEDWGINDSTLSSFKTSLDMARLALAGLPKLQTLKLAMEPIYGADESMGQLLNSLSRVTALKTLALDGLLNTYDLAQLPKQLQELYFSYQWSDSTISYDSVELSYLTALTSFGSARYVYGGYQDGSHTVLPKDRYPSSLVEIALQGALSVKPLLQLTQLQRLILFNTTTTAKELRRLTEVTSLTALELTYYGVEVASVYRELKDIGLDDDSDSNKDEDQWSYGISAAVEAMAALPVKCLDLACYTKTPYNIGAVPASAVQALGRIQGLERLRLSASTLATSPLQLAMALSQLPRLRGLDLCSLDFEPTSQLDVEEPSDISEGFNSLFAVIGGLRHLETLDLHLTPIHESLMKQLQGLNAASRLTCLRLCQCHLSDATAARLLERIPAGLLHLGLSSNLNVGAGCLAAIGQHLRHLTYLDIAHTSATNEALVHLTTLWQLKKVRSDGTAITPAARAALLRIG